MHKKIGKSIDNQKYKKYNYENANYYDFFKLDYYELNAFNQSNDLLKIFYIQNYLKLKCQYYENKFGLNNKLDNYLQKSYKRHLNPKNKNLTTFAFSTITSLVIMSQNKKKEVHS